jgi:hypothetical protein
MKGRESDWQSQLTDLPEPDLIRDIVAVGYEGLLIDRWGYTDRGSQISTSIQNVTGRAPTPSSDGRWFFFDLTGLAPTFGSPAEMATLGQSLLHHPRIGIEGCPGWDPSKPASFTWCGPRGSIRIADPSVDGRPNTFSASVVAPAGSGTLSLTVGGRRFDFAVGPAPSPISVEVPSASNVVIGFRADVPSVVSPEDTRDLRVQLFVPSVTSSP